MHALFKNDNSDNIIYRAPCDPNVGLRYLCFAIFSRRENVHTCPSHLLFLFPLNTLISAQFVSTLLMSIRECGSTIDILLYYRT